MNPAKPVVAAPAVEATAAPPDSLLGTTRHGPVLEFWCLICGRGASGRGVAGFGGSDCPAQPAAAKSRSGARMVNFRKKAKGAREQFTRLRPNLRRFWSSVCNSPNGADL